MTDADFYHGFMAWREETLLSPDVSIEAYIHHLEAESALARTKEITE